MKTSPYLPPAIYYLLHLKLMIFIADAMLGRLAKRMRLLGFDVLYDPAMEDNDVLRLALEQGRVILTRDTGLASRPLARNHLLIRSDHGDEQLDQVLEAYPTPDAGPLTRCSLCNEPLMRVKREEVRDAVPSYVYERHDGFLRCEKCERIYWKGSHIAKMHLKSS